MKFTSHNRPLLHPGLLLVLVLLLGQTLALAHDHDADAGPKDNCALCLHAHHADGVLPQPAVGIQPSVDSLFETGIPDTLFAGSFSPLYQSRAPPHIFL
ncbi:MAG: hypothetical protein WBO37_01805 [Gammaproteobacteria bacterium]